VDAEKPLVLKLKQRLRTEAGNAEMFFAIGSFVRVGTDSEIEMVDAGLTSATIRLHRGSIIIDVFKVWGADSLKVLVGESETVFTYGGEFRFDLAADGMLSLHVLSGKGVLSALGDDQKLKKKQLAQLSGQGIAVDKFKKFPADSLTAWHEERAATILASIPMDQRRKKRVGYKDGVFHENESPFGARDLPDRSSAGL
jgi:ferric-dicitrate binding protein FerR (iron transport regulator)